MFLRPTHISNQDIYSQNRNANLVRDYIRLDSSFKDYMGDHDYVTWEIGGVHLDVFRPHGCSTSNLNNHSLVTFMSYNGSTVLIPGDCEVAAWNELLESPSFQKVVYGTMILVAPHHGLASGYSSALMSKIKPDICVISEGYVTGTDVCSYYSNKCIGHQVSIKGGIEESRRTITTRNDRNVHISIRGNPYWQGYSISTLY